MPGTGNKSAGCSGTVLIIALGVVIGTPARGLNPGLGEGTLHEFEPTERAAIARMSERSPAGCGVELVVTGGRFSPDVCQFEIIARGADCDSGGCRPRYAIALRNSSHDINEISSVALFDIRELKTGTYRFDPADGMADFKGQLIDKGAIARPFLRGLLALELLSDDKVHVSCEILFDNRITVQGSGVIPVKRVSAP